MAHTNHAVPPTDEEVTRDLLGRLRGASGSYWTWLAVFGVLGLVGLIALLGLVASGPEPRSKWGYAAAALGFLISTAQGAPIVAFLTRLAKGFWGIPLRRAAELFTVSGLVTTPLFIILLFQVPDWKGRWSIWFDWPGAPQLWDSIAIVVLSLLGLTLLYLTSLPDLAAARDRTGGQGYRRWSLGWTGTTRQWQVLTGGIVVLGAFYLMFLVFVHVLVVADLAMSLAPPWKSSIIAPYHAVSGLQAGLATALLALWALRRFGGLSRYVGRDPFWSGAKPLLGLSLLFFYFTWSELLTTWYGRTPEEEHVLRLLMFGPYQTLFILSFLCNFVLPFGLLIWNPIRVSINGPPFVAGIIVFGNLVDRIRIYVASWSVAGPPGEHFDVPATQFPGVTDLLIFVGAAAAIGFLYLLALRIVPAISLWEYKMGLLLKVERPYIRAEVAVIAKPQ
jgi:molybdopterin-containing oxidoreductase family membrane subunit